MQRDRGGVDAEGGGEHDQGEVHEGHGGVPAVHLHPEESACGEEHVGLLGGVSQPPPQGHLPEPVHGDHGRLHAPTLRGLPDVHGKSIPKKICCRNSHMYIE